LKPFSEGREDYRAYRGQAIIFPHPAVTSLALFGLQNRSKRWRAPSLRVRIGEAAKIGHMVA